MGKLFGPKCQLVKFVNSGKPVPVGHEFGPCSKESVARYLVAVLSNWKIGGHLRCPEHSGNMKNGYSWLPMMEFLNWMKLLLRVNQNKKHQKYCFNEDLKSNFYLLPFVLFQLFFILQRMNNIAINTFRELLRNRILTVILFFACALIGFSIVLASLSLGETKRIIIDFGLSMIEIGWLIAVIFVGGQILFKEIEGRTIYLILSKPIERKDYILGKFFGFGAIILLLVLLQGLVLTGLVIYQGIPLNSLMFVAIAAIAM